ncbi:MAG: GNAT family N-acetyltransferase [Proteobacteria bacterium]|nr:GNAT family N-acetyltransferase [Pseudomonadota bacterium]MDA0952293.1 GNAT family N-acetyltransferase [Pseudomonadota bacterium]
MPPALVLRPVDVTNFARFLSLTLAPGQENFVATNAEALAEAAYVPGQEAAGAWLGDDPVGLAVWGPYHVDGDYLAPPEPGSTYIEHVMIAAPFQGRGLGRHLVELVSQRILADRSCRRAVLAVHETNTKARALYTAIGYRQFGTDRDGDPLMELHRTGGG